MDIEPREIRIISGSTHAVEDEIHALRLDYVVQSLTVSVLHEGVQITAILVARKTLEARNRMALLMSPPPGALGRPS